MGRPRKVTSQPKRGKSKKTKTTKPIQPALKKYKPKISFNETFFRALIEHNSNAITLLNEIGEVIYDSPAASGMLGYNPTEWIGKSVFQLVHSDDLPKIHRLFEHLLKTHGSHASAIFRIRHKDNHWLWIDATATNLLHEPSVKAIVVNYRDVTQIKQAEETLNEIEGRFKQVWEVTTDAMALSDSQGIVIAANPAYYNLYGYKPEQVIGQSFAIIFPKDIRKYAEEQYQQTFNSDIIPPMFESVVQLADGTERIVESRASFLTSAGQRTAMLSIIRDITERKAFDARIQNERNFSNHALESLPGVFYMYDKNRKFVRWNKNFESVTGYTAEEIAGMSPLDFFAKEEKHLVDERIEEVFRNGNAWVEADFISKDGKRTPYYFTGKVFESEDTTYLIGTGIDISARKENEEKLQTSESNLKLFVEYAPASIAMLDHDMKYIVVSKRYLADYRLKNENIIGRSHYEVFPDIPENWKEIHKRCLAGAIEKAEADPFPREDGTTDWVRWEIHPWRQANGKIGGIILFSEVITERINAAVQLRESEERFRLVVEIAPSAMIVINKEGKIQFANTRANHLFGYKAEELVGKSIDMLVPQKYREHHASFRTDFYLNPQTRAMGAGRELFGLHKNGSEIPLEIGLAPFESDQGMLTLASIIDITERKQAEEALRSSEEQYRSLFEDSPIALWVEDFSEVKIRLDELKQNGILDIPQYIREHPEFVETCSNLVTILDVNQAALKLYNAIDKSQLLGSLSRNTVPVSTKNFEYELIQLSQGRLNFAREGIDQTLAGHTIHVN
ncbi:MAG: PAS domain S-box protein, partial [Anaerolineales bacterium]|nr:PAS domain S-box protein [Anaerolineales bacterium]